MSEVNGAGGGYNVVIDEAYHDKLAQAARQDQMTPGAELQQLTRDGISAMKQGQQPPSTYRLDMKEQHITIQPANEHVQHSSTAYPLEATPHIVQDVLSQPAQREKAARAMQAATIMGFAARMRPQGPVSETRPEQDNGPSSPTR